MKTAIPLNLSAFSADKEERSCRFLLTTLPGPVRGPAMVVGAESCRGYPAMNYETGVQTAHTLASGPQDAGLPPAILVVDDEEVIAMALSATLANDGYDLYTETSPHRALENLHERQFAVILSDQRMPGISGLELMEEARRLQPDATRMLITGVLCLDTVIEAINRGEIYRFILKPWIREELVMSVRNAVQRHLLMTQNAAMRARAERENSNLQDRLRRSAHENEELFARNRDLEASARETAHLIAKSFELFLPSVGNRARIAQELCLGMAEVLGLNPQQRRTLEMSALLHDSGLLCLPRSLIHKWQTKPELLTPEEQRSIERHPALGESLAHSGWNGAEIGGIIRAHHERWDGTGYPDRLAREAIPWLARLLAVASFYASSKESPTRCLQMVQSMAGTAFDMEATRIFIAALPKAPLSPKQAEIPLSGLRPGMKLARGVYASDGQILLPAGRLLTSNEIDAVTNHSQIESADHVFVVYC